MDVETYMYETSSKQPLFSNMRFIAMFITVVCVSFLIKLRWPKKMSNGCMYVGFVRSYRSY